MATTTANYGLTKPERSDNYSVDVMSGNMDKIDSAIKTETDAVAQRVGTLEGKVSAIENEFDVGITSTKLVIKEFNTGGAIGSVTFKPSKSNFDGALTGLRNNVETEIATITLTPTFSFSSLNYELDNNAIVKGNIKVSVAYSSVDFGGGIYFYDGDILLGSQTWGKLNHAQKTATITLSNVNSGHSITVKGKNAATIVDGSAQYFTINSITADLYI